MIAPPFIHFLLGLTAGVLVTYATFTGAWALLTLAAAFVLFSIAFAGRQ